MNTGYPCVLLQRLLSNIYGDICKVCMTMLATYLIHNLICQESSFVARLVGQNQISHMLKNICVRLCFHESKMFAYFPGSVCVGNK